jgi:putative effector of murein hydrolase
VVAVVVVAYRFAIALAAPLGLARSASLRKQRLAVAIPIALAILAQIGLDVSQLVLWAQQYGYQLFAYNLSEIILSQLITGAGLALAVVLYQYQPQIDNASLTTLPGVPAPADQLVISTPVRDLQIEQ